MSTSPCLLALAMSALTNNTNYTYKTCSQVANFHEHISDWICNTEVVIYGGCDDVSFSILTKPTIQY